MTDHTDQPTTIETAPMTPEQIRQAQIESWVSILRLAQSQLCTARKELLKLGVPTVRVAFYEIDEKNPHSHF